MRCPALPDRAAGANVIAGVAYPLDSLRDVADHNLVAIIVLYRLAGVLA